MNKALTADLKMLITPLVLVYVAGAILTKLTIDTSPQSDHRVSLGWPYYLAKDPVQFTTGIRSALTAKFTTTEAGNG